jgi:2-polyprenyl-3-methyl-5-hydroxy-6-metoxy-1,4-benzoquinol methylase
MLPKFYNQLAPLYKYFYQDWEASLVNQAVILDQVIKEYFEPDIKTIRDVACGIGTQSLGLAELGYQVIGSDISEDAIQTAKREAESRNLSIEFSIQDMRNIDQGQFDLIMACDNAIPHLLSDREILRAYKTFYNHVMPGGGCIISVRDYAQMEWIEGETRLALRRVQDIEGGRIILFDLLEFNTDSYTITVYFLEEMDGKDIKVSAVSGGEYYCVEIDKLEYLFLQAGFRKVVTIRDRYFQPLMVAKKA